MKSKEVRNCGFDALRILAMFYIVMWHILGHGKLLSYSSGYDRIILEMIHSCITVCVNCFWLLMGYFQYQKSFRLNKLAGLWGSTIFYSSGIFLLAVFIGLKPFLLIRFLTYCCPISSGAYWFITVYFVLYFFTSYLNRLLKNLSLKEHIFFIALLLLVFCFYPTFTPRPFLVNSISDGYSLPWAITVYVSGALLFRIQDKLKYRAVFYFCAYLVCSFLGFLLCKLAEYFHLSYCSALHFQDNMRSYNSPFVFFASVFLFVAFSKMHFSSKLVVRMAPLMFGIYLIHEHNYIRALLYSDFLHFERLSGCKYITGWVFFYSGVIFVSCMILEWLRVLMFFVMKRIFGKAQM